MKSSNLPAVVEQENVERMPVRITPERRKEYNKRVNEAAAFAKFGVKAIRIKNQTLAKLGAHAEAVGIKKVGHGKVIVASENAEEVIARLGALAQELMEKDAVANAGEIREICALQRVFNQQLIDCGQVHINADKLPSTETAGKAVSIPYPAGGSVVVAVAGGQMPGIVEGGKAT